MVLTHDHLTGNDIQPVCCDRTLGGVFASNMHLQRPQIRPLLLETALAPILYALVDYQGSCALATQAAMRSKLIGRSGHASSAHSGPRTMVTASLNHMVTASHARHAVRRPFAHINAYTRRARRLMSGPRDDLCGGEK